MKTTKTHLCLVVAAIVFIFQTCLRFSNMDMTETQLFVAFWPYHFASLFLMLATIEYFIRRYK